VDKMNKKDIASIRKQFKPDNEYMNIREVFNVYVQKETGDIFHHVSTPFEMLERETQDLFYDNFKKVLTGSVNEKLFPLKFNLDNKMNKKDIASIRKQFKPDNEYMNIREVFNVYVQKETGDIFHHVSTPFEMLERETQDLFYDNFKKVLTGRVNEKLFPLKFNREIEENTQHLLYQSLQINDSESWQEQ